MKNIFKKPFFIVQYTEYYYSKYEGIFNDFDLDNYFKSIENSSILKIKNNEKL